MKTQIFHGYNFTGEELRPNPYEPATTCTEDIFENTSPDLRTPTLPWAIQYDWGCEREQGKEINVIVMENEVLRATITPQFGGRVWSLFDKKHEREIFLNNPAHQPANIAHRKYWVVLSGCVCDDSTLPRSTPSIQWWPFFPPT